MVSIQESWGGIPLNGTIENSLGHPNLENLANRGVRGSINYESVVLFLTISTSNSRRVLLLCEHAVKYVFSIFVQLICYGDPL